jgi:hypothetical protein
MDRPANASVCLSVDLYSNAGSSFRRKIFFAVVVSGFSDRYHAGARGRQIKRSMIERTTTNTEVSVEAGMNVGHSCGGDVSRGPVT